MSSSVQMAVLKKHFNMTSAAILDINENSLQLYPLSMIRAMTETSKSWLRIVICAPRSVEFIWLQSIGSVLLTVSSDTIGINVPRKNLASHVVWPEKNDGL